MGSLQADKYSLEYRPKYQSYRYLMTDRINEVLLVSSVYDSFIIEQDVRLSDQIFEEFHNLNLRTLPHIHRASSVDQALDMLRNQAFDLVITMRRLGEVNPFRFAEQVKQIQEIPVVLLLNNSSELSYLPSQMLAEGSIDHTFVWNGNSTVFLAIIKLLEDRLNVDRDTEKGDVRVIIVVEDSIRFYSLYLPVLYAEIMRQTQRLIHEGGNDYHSLLQMRSRPKILLASSYEEAVEDYQQYRDHLLGLITDVKFPRDGEISGTAGFDLVREIRTQAPTLPILMQSSEEANRLRSESLNSYFLNKNSRSLLQELRTFLLEYMGFGSFTFRLPDGEVVGAADNLMEMRDVLEQVPLDAFVFHARNDHFSGWLAARGEFAMARQLKPRKVSEFEDQEDLRRLIISSVEVILEERLGVIVDFDRGNYLPQTRFLRLRPGSLGGKGRGLAFLLFLRGAYHVGLHEEFPEVSIQIPKTVVIGTDEFDEFMRANQLHQFVLEEHTDREIKERFLQARMDDQLRADLLYLFQENRKPLAVRSSSIFEDTLYQPFAGVFATYMLPNCHPDPNCRVDQLISAIKLVYASTYLKTARSYAETMGMSLTESKMAVVLQEVVGRSYQGRYYPEFSGTASSYNYYPLGESLQPEDRIAYVVHGLGKTVVDGGLARRFSPRRPKVNLYAGIDEQLNSSQRSFYALRESCREVIDLERGEDSFLAVCDLQDAITDGTLREVADTYQPSDGTVSSGFFSPDQGSPVITFNRQLKFGTFPLAEIINRMLKLGEDAMGCPVEMEFAGNLTRSPGQDPAFYLLQLRPYLEYDDSLLLENLEVPDQDLLVSTSEVSGNRVIADIRDVVYVMPGSFDPARTRELVGEIRSINRQLCERKIPYLLIGPGRWGTYDRHLGIPVDWSDINGARAIMEVDFADFRVDHSQGSHFFHNITSAGIPYFYVKYQGGEDFLDWEWLHEQRLILESPGFRHVRTDQPLLIIANSKNRRGEIVKPDAAAGLQLLEK